MNLDFRTDIDSCIIAVTKILTGDGGREMGDGRWETGDGIWGTGDGRWNLHPKVRFRINISIHAELCL